ncbi:uncharacterized protein LOC134531358 [Bacillus rossius redtenbacheri]|uniref:uncharacterized protein LOC134531358 n=1 Tax=Bacillus rossius redtenbacheri TaxID=93214 RepID=UPI002FDE6F0D
MHIQHHNTPSYHPRVNPTEPMNQDLKIQLRLRLNDVHTKWDQHLADALFCTRCRVNAATGHTPAEMVQGSNLHLPGEWATFGTLHDGEGTEERDQCRKNMYEDARRRQMTYSQKITPKTIREPPLVRAGDQVYARVHPLSAAPRNYCAGLSPRWSGPYKIQRRVGRTAYLFRLRGRRIQKIHHDDLRLATTPGECMLEEPKHDETHNDMHDDEQPVADEPEPATREHDHDIRTRTP